MKKLFSLLLVLVISFPIVSIKTMSAHASQEQKIYCTATIDDEFADNKVMVVLTESASRSDKDYSVAEFVSYGCMDVKDLTEFATQTVQSGVDNEMVNTENYKRVLSLTLNQNSKENVLQVINSLIEREDVLYAGPDYMMTTSSTSSNDTYATSQWAINNLGLKDCWDFTQGSTEVVVGVMDTGIDGTHPDLSSSIINSLCRDFTSGQEVAVGCPTDIDGHGTHVAGIIAAVGNNNLGITGVNWNVKLVSLKVFGGQENSLASNVGAAIDYAQRVGIKILNFSGGWANDQQYNDMAFDSFIETYSGLLICAAGNDAKDIDVQAQYPASYNVNNVLSVGAINSGNNICEFSNYGEETVDVFAPGENILSTFPEDACETDLVFPNGTKFCELNYEDRVFFEEAAEERGFSLDFLIENFNSVFPHRASPERAMIHHENGYHYMRGTSMATPYVAGVAALLLSINPDLTAYQLRTAILNSAETINITLPDNTRQSVKKLNAYNAVKYVLTNNFNEHIYVTNTRTDSKYINNNIKQIYVAKLHTIEGATASTIAITSNNAINVKIYDEDFTLVTNCVTNNNTDCVTISKNFDTSIYYMTVQFVSDNTIGSLHININGTPHEHSLSLFWFYHDIRSHRKKCSTCQELVLEGHYVAYDDVMDGDNRANCLGCLANLDLSRDIASIVSVGGRQITLNGSYILPSGIVVLKDEDVEAYLAGTLVFYDENELLLTA